MPRLSRFKAFTLVELLVVISIIVVLLALLVPSLDKAIEQTQRVVCATRQRAMHTIYSTYAFENNRVLPLFPNPGTEGSWLHDMSFVQARGLFGYGAGDESHSDLFYCPSDDKLLPKYWFGGQWSNDNGILVVGWVFMTDRVGGWPSNNAGVYVFERGYGASKRITGQGPSAARALLLLDRQLFVGGWVGWAGGDGAPNHTNGVEPVGGNNTYLDGHVQWNNFQDMEMNLNHGNAVQYWW